MRRRFLWIVIGLLLLAAAFRVAVAHWLPNDAPGDGVIYAQMARNVLEQHVYSHEAQPPYNPSLVRLPGYPLFLATVYSIFGHTNNGAVRVVQALIDAATCGLIALLAFFWQPDEQKKRASAIGALVLAAICPFTTIYAATILTEVPTNFLVMAMFMATTLALRKTFPTEETEKSITGSPKQAILWWVVAGLLGGLAVFFRPDNGLFVAAIGLTLLISSLRQIWSAPRGRSGEGALDSSLKKVFRQMLLCGTLFSISFALVLVPWTIRNWRIFHLFQPLAPAHAEMPGEFVPRGYGLWLRTWLDDESYIAPLLWSLDTDPIDFDDIPPYAFDSADEKNRVAALIEKYNNPDGAESSQTNAPAAPQPSPSAANPKASPSPKKSQPNSNANSQEENTEETEEEETDKEPQGPVEMTPEIDAGFAQIARERIAHHRFQFYVLLPIKRARTMWFDTHSQYWPFEGTLLPFEDLDYDSHQQIWLPLFAGLTALYTLLGLAGAWFLWGAGKFEARQWVLLVGLAIGLRLILFSSMENPEPRYLVEFFPFLSILGGIAIGQIGARTSLSANSGTETE
jgi:hypothetical protein